MPICTVVEIKAYLGISHGDHDAFFSLVADSVSADLDDACRCSFSAEIEATRYVSGGSAALVIDDHPLIEVASVTDLIAEEEIESSRYVVDLACGLIRRADGSTWPSGDHRYEVELTAGYEEAPKDIKGIALALCAGLYERRDLSQRSVAQGGITASYGDLWGADVERVIKRHRREVF